MNYLIPSQNPNHNSRGGIDCTFYNLKDDEFENNRFRYDNNKIKNSKTMR